MSSSVSEDQDQRSNAGLEDLTTMTIESLRGRLLSERAISKTARQRADELAKRVLELENQLKMVSLQRKRAEKATADVLAILESNGVSDASEEFDSNSDGETTISDSKVSNHTVKKEGASTDFEVRRHDIEAYSSSEIDSSSTGRSLSWKSGKDSPNYMERKKFMDSGSRRKSSSFASNSSLPKRVGKSCRRIRRRETRSVAEELQGDSNMHDKHDDRAATCSQDIPNRPDIGPETVEDDPENHEVGNPQEAPSSGFSGTGVAEPNVSGRTEKDKTMERALHDQAKKKADGAEEKAQREWEENYRENNSSVLDSCDPGNRSDVTEERDEIKAPGHTYPQEKITCLNQGAELEVANASFTADHKPKVPNDLLATQQVDTRYTHGVKTGSMVANESPSSEFAFPMSNGTRGKLFLRDPNGRPSHSSFMSSLANGSPGEPLGHVPLSYANNGESSESRKELALMPQNSPSNLDTVLEALQQAKLSLKDKLCYVPLSEVGSSGKGIEPFFPPARSRDGMEIPVGCPGIFRLPTDFQFERTTKANYLGLDPALSLSYHRPKTPHNKLMSSPYVEARSSSFVGDQFWTSSSPPFMGMRSGIHMGNSPFTERASEIHTSAIPFTENLSDIPNKRPLVERPQFVEMRSGIHMGNSPFMERASEMHTSAIPFTENRSDIPSRRPLFEPALDATFSGRTTYLDLRSSPGLPPSGNYAYPTYPVYPDMRPQLPSGERFSRSSSMEFGMPSAARFSLYDDHIRPNMYK